MWAASRCNARACRSAVAISFSASPFTENVEVAILHQHLNNAVDRSTRASKPCSGAISDFEIALTTNALPSLSLHKKMLSTSIYRQVLGMVQYAQNIRVFRLFLVHTGRLTYPFLASVNLLNCCLAPSLF